MSHDEMLREQDEALREWVRRPSQTHREGVEALNAVAARHIEALRAGRLPDEVTRRGWQVAIDAVLALLRGEAGRAG